MPDNTQSSFRGFKRPRYTQVPDELLDDIMVDLTGAELKVLLYIIRHTFGYGKDSDTISLNQMLSGIRKSDGTIVDRGTGLTKKTLLAAINTLEERRFVLTERRRSQEKGDEPTAYRLHIDNRPIVEETTLPLGEKLHQGGGAQITPGGWGSFSPTQETTIQETIKQDIYLSNIRKVPSDEKDDSSLPTEQVPHTRSEQTSILRQTSTEHNEGRALDQTPTLLALVDQPGHSMAQTASNTHKLKRYAADDDNPSSSASHGFEPIGSTLEQQTPLTPPSPDEGREVIDAYIRDFARELHDTAPIKSSVTRAFRLYQASKWTLDGFISALYEARAITKERSGSIQASDGAKVLPAKRRMAYFFACLEDKLGLREQPGGAA